MHEIHAKMEYLKNEIAEYAEKPLTMRTAEYLSVCRGAYKALKMARETTPEKGVYGSGASRYSGPYDVYAGDDEMRISKVGAAGPLTEDEAKEWMSEIVNEDGTVGPKFTREQAHKALMAKGVDIPAYCAWAAINATYSDIGEELKRYGVSNVDAYADIAKAYWFHDTDAVADKLGVYYRCIVKK